MLAHAALITSLVTGSIAVRSSVDLFRGNASTGDPTELRIFATTFNAGNEIYDGSPRFEELMDLLVEGHEDEGQEADIMFLGFQEFRDNKYTMGNSIRKTKAWRRLVSSSMAAFKADVEEAAKAPAHVLSAKEALAKDVKDLGEAVRSELSKLQVSYGTKAQDPSSNLTNVATVFQRLAPIHSWTEAALKRIAEIKGMYPNLVYSDTGNKMWESYTTSIDNAKDVELQLLESLKSVSNQLGAWQKNSERDVQKLARPAAFGVHHDHVEVGLHVQKFDSGWKCEIGKHFDTFLYAYVNPFSKWKITSAPFNSQQCERRTGGSQTNPGCNIDNIQGQECGKVVNLLRLKAELGPKKKYICGLNTHMSFAAPAEARAKYIEKAMKETANAKCDSVFFMGDFNSRVHCEEDSKQDLPPFERMGRGGSSLDYVLDKFCKKDQCELKESNLDELNQILNKERLECYEEFSKPNPDSYFGGKIDYWDIPGTHNPVKSIMGLREVASPAWPPSYKLGRKEKIKDGVWSRCFKGDGKMCFINKSKRGKHNPAWTDRILMQSASDSVQLVTTEYSRRPIASIASDHAPVVARVTMQVA